MTVHRELEKIRKYVIANSMIKHEHFITLPSLHWNCVTLHIFPVPTNSLAAIPHSTVRVRPAKCSATESWGRERPQQSFTLIYHILLWVLWPLRRRKLAQNGTSSAVECYRDGMEDKRRCFQISTSTSISVEFDVRSSAETSSHYQSFSHFRHWLGPCQLA